MSTSDADRAWRQQQILLAIREEVLDHNLLQEVPKLVTTLKDSIETDMTLEAMLELARLMPDIDADNLTQVVLEEPLVYSHRRGDGAAVLLPRWGSINAVVAELMGASVGTPPPSTPNR
jgi:anionic cell wall polymer biosynthesis LytR-Cps2A-Psr (LCP) family protein